MGRASGPSARRPVAAPMRRLPGVAVELGVASQAFLAVNRPAVQGNAHFAVVLPDQLGAPGPRERSKGLSGPFFAVGDVVDQRSRKTGMVRGGSGRSVALTTPVCQ